MSIIPTSSSMMMAAENLLSSTWARVQGLFGHHDFSPEQSLVNTPGIDPHFIPRVAMSNANLDVGVLAKLSNMGLKRGKEITAATHPELYHEWQSMCTRAGIGRVPQLILAESKSLNAASLNGEDAVVMTTGLLKRLNLREVRAVLGHELGHEASDHTTPRGLALVLLGGGGLVAGNYFAKRGGFGAFIADKPNPGMLRRAAKALFGSKSETPFVLGTELYMAGGALLGTVAANQISVRPTELDADRKSVAIAQDPEALISALIKLDASSGKNTLLQLYHKIESGYPSIETRVSRLREIAKTMPMPVPAVAIIPKTAQSAVPSSQISDVSQAARVGTPVPALATEI